MLLKLGNRLAPVTRRNKSLITSVASDVPIGETSRSTFTHGGNGASVLSDWEPVRNPCRIMQIYSAAPGRWGRAGPSFGETSATEPPDLCSPNARR